jgi:parallel beta-helix repeat protein
VSVVQSVGRTVRRGTRAVCVVAGAALFAAAWAVPAGAHATTVRAGTTGTTGTTGTMGTSTVRASDAVALAVPDSNFAIPAGALFVDATHGSDTNHGALKAPFATIARAIVAAKAGGTIVLRAGTYREAPGIIRKRLTFQAYPHEQVWLSGSVAVSDWSQDLVDRPDGGVWEHTGWTTQFCHTCFDPRAIDPAYPNAGLPDMVFVNGHSLAQVSSLAAVGPGSFYIDYAQQALYIGDDPTVPGTLVEASTQSYAMQFNAPASGSALLGIGVVDYAPDWNFTPIPAMVIVNGASGLTFDRDLFANSASRGLTLYGANSAVTNSWFVDNGYTALHGNKADSVDVEHNFVAGNNNEHFFPGFSPAASASGIKFTTTANAIIRDNVVQDNYANGIWFDVSSSNPTIVDNLAARNNRNGIYVEITGGGIVASNLSIDNGQGGIKLSGTTDVRVYNNTLFGNLTYQLSVHDDGRVNTNAAQIAQGITWITAGNQLVNNLLVAPDTGSIGSLLYSEDLDTPKVHDAATMITTLEGNVYGRAKAKNPGALAVWTHPAPIAISRFANLPQLRAGTGDELTGLEYSGYTVSPIFTDPNHGDFTLRATSGAIASGQPLPADIAAAIGVPANLTPDRGALVYPTVASAPTTP